MNLQRNITIIALLFMFFIIWQTWIQNKNLQLQRQTTQRSILLTKKDNNNILSNNKHRQIVVKTDVLELVINLQGGNIEQAFLLSYSKELKSKEPFKLLETTPEFTYQAQSGFVYYNSLNNYRNISNNSLNDSYPLYNVDKKVFILSANQQKLIVPMNWTDANGNVFTKIFTLKRGEYAIDVNHTVKNYGNKSLLISSFAQLKQSIKLPLYRDSGNNNFTLHTFRGAAYSTSENKYRKYKFNVIASNKNLNIHSKGGWVAMLQQYFATAWIPNNDSINNLYTSNLNDGVVAIGYRSQPISVNPGQICQIKSKLWIGPEIQEKMASIAPNLDMTVDYGWLWFISQPLFKLLSFIHSFLRNWGFSIIVITFIVRSIMYPFTKAQYISMAKIRILQPKIQSIRERFSYSKQRQSQEIIALYKSEKINPLSGCFPLLIQMPIFLALYYMLIGSVELRHAPFILWIHDLSAKDPFYILPILMGITMFLIQKISSSNVTDQIHQKIMIFMPIIFTIFFLWFPSGLVLYYTISNLVTVIQQQLIFRSLEKHGLIYNQKKQNSK